MSLEQWLESLLQDNRELVTFSEGYWIFRIVEPLSTTGVKSPPAGHWKSQACIATKRMLELTAFLRKIMLLGLLRGSPRLRDEALRILDGFEASTIDGSDAQDVLINNETSPLIEKTSTDNNKCMWVMVEDPDIDLWCTSCGEEFHLEADSPSDNHMKYCCYCGKEITEG